MKYVITFSSVHFVIKAEKLLTSNGIKCRLIPTPRQLSSDCGMALEVQDEDLKEINSLLKDSSCTYLSVNKIP